MNTPQNIPEGSATITSPDCISIILNYLTPLPKIPFEEELLLKTRFIRYELSVYRIGTDSYYNINTGDRTYFQCMISRILVSDGWHISIK